jgi:hypothetical protein
MSDVITTQDTKPDFDISTKQYNIKYFEITNRVRKTHCMGRRI